MRFDQLVLQVPGAPFELPFHDRFTVVSGLDQGERAALVEGVIGALGGSSDEPSELHYFDATGRRAVLRVARGSITATYDDGEPAICPVGSMVENIERLRALMILDPSDLADTAAPVDDDPPELADARERLEELSRSLEEAEGHRARITDLKNEIVDTKSAIRTTADAMARWEYSQVLGRLEAVKAEEEACIADTRSTARDELLVEEAAELRERIEEWQKASDDLDECKSAFGNEERLDPQTLATSLLIPDTPPTDLDRRVELLAAAERDHDEAADLLRRLAADELPEPSDPIVRELARLDQDALWQVHRQLRTAEVSLAACRMSLDGGVTSVDGYNPVATMEEAHSRFVRFEDQAQRGLIPGTIASAASLVCALLVVMAAPVLALILVVASGGVAWASIFRPRLAAKQASIEESTAVRHTGAASYLGFHLRRVEATHDPDIRERLEVSELEARLARQTWTELTGGLDTQHTGLLEDEVRSYARAVAELGSRADRIDEAAADADRLRRLVDKARGELAETCRTYGIDDPPVEDGAPMLRRLVAHQLHVRVVAIRQAALEQAEATLTALAIDLEDRFDQVGLDRAALAERAASLDLAVETARQRIDARERSRSSFDIRTDLQQLEAEAAGLARSEWGVVAPDLPRPPDEKELLERLEDLEGEMAKIRASVVDVDRVIDRRDALNRRVAALQASLDATRRSVAPAVVADVQRRLQARFAAVASLGPASEHMPLVFDDAFTCVAPSRKWDLLDMLHRMAERNQVLYVTDDPFVTAWARRRAEDGALRLLEAAAEDDLVDVPSAPEASYA